MPTETPAPPVPEATPPASPSPAMDEFHQQLLTLANAVRELSQSQQTLIDAVSGKTPTPSAQPVTAPQTISGDPGDGLRPSAMVDYTRLSPVQQIAMGLRTATPQGPRVLPTRSPAPHPKGAADAELASAGAD